MSTQPTAENDVPEVGGIRIASAGHACDNDACSVLVYNPDGPRRIGNPVRGCPGCGQDGFEVRFGIGLDRVIPPGSGDTTEAS